jgi:glyoxylase-like metal-dependent hydrolase (beta-lactamase superfamily II)
MTECGEVSRRLTQLTDVNNLPKEILNNLYSIEVPLPRNPLKATNSYVIKAQPRNLIIDTGFNRDECMRAMNAALAELGIDLSRTDFFVTHMHSDHLGLVPTLATGTSKIYFNQRDADIYHHASNSEYLNYTRSFALMNGFPENELKDALDRHPGYRYRAQGRLKFTYLREGDIIGIDDYRFRCVETPGHTLGHMCLYEPDKKILVAGDHVLANITPNITLWSDDWNPLNEYLGSLEKVYALDVELVLPGHRDTFKDCRGRIRELQHHHRARADEVLSILEGGDTDAYEIASRMSWDIDCDSWDQFPVSQKWFATGEAIAHLKYLEEKGRIRKKMCEHKTAYSLG